MRKNENPVQIKGQKDGLWIFLDDQLPSHEVFTILEQKLSSSNNFFSGAEVTIHSGDRTFSSEEETQLREIVEEKYALQIRAIEEIGTFTSADVEIEETDTPVSADIEKVFETSAQESLKTDNALELEEDDEFMRVLDETFRIPVQRRPQQEPASVDPYDSQEQTFYFRGTVRSGQSLEYPGNIVIVGDVNPGAYVIASGDIIVMGRLNGVVHAGAEGEERASVIGAKFSPSQLRIAQYIGRPPDENPQAENLRAHTERASIKDGMIVIEPVL